VITASRITSAPVRCLWAPSSSRRAGRRAAGSPLGGSVRPVSARRTGRRAMRAEAEVSRFLESLRPYL